MTTTGRMSWSAGRVPADYVLGGVRAVLPGAVIEDARVVVRDGLIAEAGPAPAGLGRRPGRPVVRATFRAA